LCSRTVCDNETDSRVGADRCYYAVAHLLWLRLETYLAAGNPFGAVYELRMMKRDINAAIRAILLVIGSSLRTRVGGLWTKRVEASYDLATAFGRRKFLDSLEDATSVAKEMEGGIVERELDDAYSKKLLDLDWWRDLRQRLSQRNSDETIGS